MGDFNLEQFLPQFAKFYIPFLFALCFHEFAHGWVAKKKGDNTAEMMGRLTLNPVSHADPFGTVLMPILGVAGVLPFVFGWAKPVPVNPSNLSKPKEDMFWIALAGPASNMLLAVLGMAVLVFYAQNSLEQTYFEGIQYFVIINLFLCFFNLIPLHPLDGGKIIARYLPHNANRWLEDNAGMLNIVLIASIMLGGLTFLSYIVKVAYSLLISLFI